MKLTSFMKRTMSGRALKWTTELRKDEDAIMNILLMINSNTLNFLQEILASELRSHFGWFGTHLARRLAFRAYWASCVLPGRRAFGASSGDRRAFGASIAPPFGKILWRGV